MLFDSFIPLFLTLVIIMCSVISSQGSIIETSNLSLLLDVSEKNTLILTDISNTLYKPCNIMSEKKWRTYVAGCVRDVILDTELATKVANCIENIIVNQVDKRLVYDDAPAIINELQAKEIPMIAISLKNWSAPYDSNFGITTSEHLKKLGIHLENSVSLLGKMNNGEICSKEDVIKTEQYTFARGIIFTDKKPLDQALNAFLNNLENKPQHIIILENSLDHKEKLETIIKAHNIAITFIKHKPSDAEDNVFDETLGTIEFLKFMNNSKVVLDQEARIIQAQTPSLNYEECLKNYIKDNFSSFLEK